MRIAVDVSNLAAPLTGIGKYTQGSLRGLVELPNGGHEVVAFALTGVRGGSQAIGRALEGIAVEQRVFVVPLASKWRTLWSRAGRPAAERLLGRFDALHFGDWWYPPQAAGIRATTICDLVPLRFPQLVDAATQRVHGAKYRHAARTCDLIFAISRYTADDVAERLGVDGSRLRVAYPGVDERFCPEGERVDLGRPYVLAVGTDPRKNVDTLVAAHRLLPTDLALAVVGRQVTQCHVQEERPVIGLGYVSDDELARIYRGATVFVFPSRFEGFGIPVVEAMASGVPCVASNHASLEEACGDAAVRVDPLSPEDVAAGIERALAERDELVLRGLEHASRFTWAETARAMLAGYEAAA